VPLNSARRSAVLALALFAATLLPGLVAVGLAGAATAANRSHPDATANCSTLSASKLTSLLGVKVSNPSSSTTGPGTTCRYPITNGVVILTYNPNSSASYVSAEIAMGQKEGEKFAPLHGYGNEADLVSLGSLTAGLWVLKGNFFFTISDVTTAAKLEAVAKQVLPSI
jgi:hypothetical protein